MTTTSTEALGDRPLDGLDEVRPGVDVLVVVEDLVGTEVFGERVVQPTGMPGGVGPSVAEEDAAHRQDVAADLGPGRP